MGNDEELTVQELEQNLTCKMYLGTKFYEQLNKEGKELFESTPEGFCATFTAYVEDGITLGNCIMTFCEVGYIALNPKYQAGENTQVKCELYKNSKDGTTFSVLVTLQYQEDKEPHHELLIFAQRELTDYLYSFELVGDQTMFAM